MSKGAQNLRCTLRSWIPGAIPISWSLDLQVPTRHQKFSFCLIQKKHFLGKCLHFQPSHLSWWVAEDDMQTSCVRVCSLKNFETYSPFYLSSLTWPFKSFSLLIWDSSKKRLCATSWNCILALCSSHLQELKCLSMLIACLHLAVNWVYQKY